MKGILIKTNSHEQEVKEFNKKDLLQFLYKELEVNTVEALDVKIGKVNATIWCDEEGLFEENPIMTAINYKDKMAVFGNIFLTSSEVDDEGYIKRGFTKKEIEEIKEHIGFSFKNQSFILNFTL